MVDYLARGRDFISQGDRKLQSLGWFSNKYEDAAELYEKGANHLKLAKAWKEAGEAYEKLAQVQTKLDSKHDTATAFVEGAKAFQKVDHRRAVHCLQRAVALYTDMGRLGMAARQIREVAEILEREGGKEEALVFYDQAADLFATDNSTAEANKCLLKVAEFSAEAEKYAKAIDIYEAIARKCAENNLLRFSTKGHLLHAAICSLCLSGPGPTAERLQRYKEIDINFDGSRECNLLESVVEAMENGDSEAFTNAVAEYDSLTRLDAFKTSLLLRAKRKISEPPTGEEEDLT